MNMNDLERNSKVISFFLTFILFEIILVNIFDRTLELAEINTYVPSFTLALFASTALFVKLKDKFKEAVKISYLFYELGRLCR